jgi:hypothetical protein
MPDVGAALSDRELVPVSDAAHALLGNWRARIAENRFGRTIAAQRGRDYWTVDELLDDK